MRIFCKFLDRQSKMIRDVIYKRKYFSYPSQVPSGKAYSTKENKFNEIPALRWDRTQ